LNASRRLAVPVLALLALATCTPPEATEVSPAPEAHAPEIRIGLLTGAPRLDIAGDSGLTMRDTEGAAIAAAEPGVAWRVRPEGAHLVAEGPKRWRVGQPQSITIVPRVAGGLLLLGGRPYRGRLTLLRDRSGLTAINTVGLEDYLAGVIGAEMGRRDSTEAEALAAQAIVSRTFAIRNLGKRAAEGFDLYATVADQVYGGVASEYPLTRWAVGHTAGLVVTWQGVPIDAFFFSTCGGRTADGTEVFAAADRSYLVSVADTDPSGQAYCRISPRFRWHEEWSAYQLLGVLRQSLPWVTGTPVEQIGTVLGVEVSQRTRSDRVSRVTVTLNRGSVAIDGPAVRQALHPVGETSLRSALFRLTEVREGGALRSLSADGSGAGHGVGFCQWGSVGRARAGQDAPTILGAYFPGTAISRAY
jgi:stage II sporulation protein D